MHRDVTLVEIVRKSAVWSDYIDDISNRLIGGQQRPFIIAQEQICSAESQDLTITDRAVLVFVMGCSAQADRH